MKSLRRAMILKYLSDITRRMSNEAHFLQTLHNKDVERIQNLCKSTDEDLKRRAVKIVHVLQALDSDNKGAKVLEETKMSRVNYMLDFSFTVKLEICKKISKIFRTFNVKINICSFACICQAVKINKRY